MDYQSWIEQRIREADRMGFSKIFVSKYNKNISIENVKIQVVTVGKIENLVRELFS